MKVAVIFGTRPEAIKLAPVIQRLQVARDTDGVELLIISTAQHGVVLDQVLSVFNIRPDVDLDVASPNQGPSQITSLILSRVEPVLRDFKPGMVLVQGDTVSTLGGALGAFFGGYRVGHIESGLRSFNKYRPFPEETSRKLVSILTDVHFAPTETARNNLLSEGVPASQIYVTGNPVVDAFNEIIKRAGESPRNGDQRLLLVTSHRRENWGTPLESVCDALLEIVNARPDVAVIFPVHPNPLVQEIAHRRLGRKERIRLVEPLDYPAFIKLMAQSHLVLTDSGGIQEEAPCLGKPVLVLREQTERTESCDAGAAKLVGTEREKIVQETLQLLDDPERYAEMSKVRFLYGDGNAAERITEIILRGIRTA